MIVSYTFQIVPLFSRLAINVTIINELGTVSIIFVIKVAQITLDTRRNLKFYKNSQSQARILNSPLLLGSQTFFHNFQLRIEYFVLLFFSLPIYVEASSSCCCFMSALNRIPSSVSAKSKSFALCTQYVCGEPTPRGLVVFNDL
jgi:hypothetical protein